MNEKTYKVYEILKYFSEFDGERIKITSENNTVDFDFLFDKNSLPHLLGLHYMYEQARVNNMRIYVDENRNKINAQKMYDYIVDNNIDDSIILQRVKNMNQNKLTSVDIRINTFKKFMENLDKGFIVENMKPKNFGGKVNYFVVEDKTENKYNYLGIKREDGIDRLVEYNTNSELITYIQANKKYMDGSLLKENVKDIEVYSKEKKDYIPFSFRENGIRGIDALVKNDIQKEFIQKLRESLKDEDLVTEYVLENKADILAINEKKREFIDEFKNVDKEFVNKAIDECKFSIERLEELVDINKENNTEWFIENYIYGISNGIEHEVFKLLVDITPHVLPKELDMIVDELLEKKTIVNSNIARVKELVDSFYKDKNIDKLIESIKNIEDKEINIIKDRKGVER